MMDPTQSSALINVLKTGLPAERSRAISALRERLRLPDDRTLLGEVMSEALLDSEPIVRAEAAEALGEPELVEWHWPLLQALEKDEDPTVRACAAEALGDARNAAAIPILHRALGDQDETVRGYAASALGLIGSAASVAAISAQLEGEASAARFDMMAAVVRLADTSEATHRMLRELADVLDVEAYRALNVIQDLLTRSPPPAALRREAEHLRRTLEVLRQRLDKTHHGSLQDLLRVLDNTCAVAPGEPSRG